MSPTDAAVQAEVRAAVDDLPIDQRLAVFLHYFQGLTHAEVAESLDVPSGTIASRIHAAVGRLREALAGAGVVLLAGMVEGALEASEEDPVPSELTEKLLRIPTLPPPVPAAPAGGPLANAMASAMAGPFAIVMLLLATVSIALIAAVRMTRPSGTRTASAPSATTLPTVATYSTPPSAPGDTPEPPMRHGPGVDPPAAPSGELVTIDGFLVKWEDGTLHVTDQATDVKQTMATAPYVLEADSAKGLEGLALGGRSLLAFLSEPKSLGDAPRVWVRVRGTVRHEEAKTPDAFDLGVNWFTIHEFVAVDYLSEAWLAAWKLARRGLWTIDDVLRQQPTRRRRDEVIAAAQATLRSIEEMRRQRGLEGVPEGLSAFPHDPLFRRETERQELHGLWALTNPFGVTPVGVPDFPTGEELREAFFEASSQAGFRAAIVARYGEEVLDGSVSFYDGKPDRFSWTGRDLRGIVETWTPEEFLEAQGRARAITENFKKDALPEHPDYENHRARITSAGLSVEGLGEIDRQTWLVTEGVKAVSVAQGTRAERAGLRVGDVIWRAHVPNGQGKAPEGVIEPSLPSNPVNFGYLLGLAEGQDAVTLDILRNGECIQIVLHLK